MRAARYYGPGDIRIEEVEEAEPGPGQVKLRVSFNGICGSDLHEYYGAPMMVPVAAAHALTGVQAPVTLGHECGGTVVDVGAGVEDLDEGTLVTVEPIKRCGVCPSCLSGRYNICPNMAFHGYSTGQGGLSEYTIVDREMVHALPLGFSPMQSALIEPLAVSYRAVRRSEMHPGDSVVVHGAGPIGVGAALAARHLGGEVIVLDPSEERRAVVEQLGEMVVLDPTAGDAATAIRDLTGGAGPAVSIDAAGATASFELALATTAVDGRIVVVAVHQEPVAFMPLMVGERLLTGSVCYCDDFPLVIEAMAAGAYPLEGWVSTIPMTNLVQGGFEVLKAGHATKILVNPAA